jgi:hypothetical protein
MLGEQIGEERGQVTGMRVLPSDGDEVRVEVSFQASGSLLGVEMNDMATYISVLRPDGTLYGTGQGIVMTADGDAIPWTGSGIGWPAGSGMAANYRGAIYYRSNAERFARLNRLAAVFEFDVDENGQTTGKIWEWS